MRTVIAVVMALALSALCAAPVTVHAQPKRGEVVMKVGDTVHLFHSGTADVRKEVCLNDVVPVYRETMAGGHTTSKQVGKVKILSYEGDHYMQGKVVEGNVKTGDVLKKKQAACLVYNNQQ